MVGYLPRVPDPTHDTSSSGENGDVSVKWSRPAPSPLPSRAKQEEPTTDSLPPGKRRTWLRWTGRAVIVVGLLSLVFAGYRYWQEELFPAQHQERLASEFEERTELVASGLPLSEFAAEPEPPDAGQPEVVVVADEGDDPRIALPSEHVYTAREIEALTPEEERTPGIFREFAPAEGEVMGRIAIPKLDLDWMVVEGIDLELLKQGPGHIPHTALPGQPGNAVISGHRTTNGAPFFDLDLLIQGDIIEVESLTGTHTYSVIESRIVPPTGVWVTTQWDGAWLTLTTCAPKYSAAERLIVFAELIDGPNAEAIEKTFDGPYVVVEPDNA